MLFKFIRNKKLKEKKINKSSNDKNTSNNININNLSNSLISGKEYNNSYDNKFSFFTNKSIYNNPSVKNEKDRNNISLRKKNKYKKNIN